MPGIAPSPRRRRGAPPGAAARVGAGALTGTGAGAGAAHSAGPAARGPVAVLDGVALSDLDFIDIGAVMPESGAASVTVKSLLFGL